MTKAHLVATVASAFRGKKITNSLASEIYNTVVDTVRGQLLENGVARLPGLGSLTVRERAAGRRFDIAKKQMVDGKPYKVILFRAASEMRSQLNSKAK